MSCLPGDKCDYHPLTHFSGVVCAISSVAAVAFTVHAWRGLQGYYAEQARKPGGYVRRKLLQTPLPLLLRILYLCASATQILGNTGLLWNNWLYVMASTKQDDPIHPVWQPELDSASRSCIFINKFSPTNYAFVKFLGYCFLFIKQRTVRTMQPNMNWLEKMVLQNTVGILLALAVPLWLVQGDRSLLDGTCVLNVPVPITSALFVSDLLLSAAYLYLFIQPLRETIAANEARRNRAAIGAAVTPAGLVRNTTVHLHVVSPITPARGMKQEHKLAPATSAALLDAGTATVPPSPSINPSPATPVPTSPAGPAAVGSSALSVNTSAAARHMDSIKLEAVMRRNTRAAVVAVAFSSSSMLFCMLAMIFDDPYMRKLVSPIALFDCITILCTLCYVLHGGKSNPPREPAYQATVSSLAQPSGVQPHQLGAPTPSHKNGWMAPSSRVGGLGGGGAGGANLIRIAPIPSALEMPPTAGGASSAAGAVDDDDGGGLARYATATFHRAQSNPQGSPLSNDIHMTEEPEAGDADADDDADEAAGAGAQRVVRFEPENSLEEQMV